MVTVGPTTIMEGPADAVLGAATRIGSIRTARPNIAMLPRRGPWSGSSAGSGSGAGQERALGKSSRADRTGGIPRQRRVRQGAGDGAHHPSFVELRGRACDEAPQRPGPAPTGRSHEKGPRREPRPSAEG